MNLVRPTARYYQADRQIVKFGKIEVRRERRFGQSIWSRAVINSSSTGDMSQADAMTFTQNMMAAIACANDLEMFPPERHDVCEKCGRPMSRVEDESHQDHYCVVCDS